MTSSRIGRSPPGTSGLGNTVVYGRSRVPLPPARITALIGSPRVAAAAALARSGVCQFIVAVPERARLDVVEHPGADGLRELPDSVVHGALGKETEAILDLLEGDPVVPRVGAARGPLHLAS